ncbi:MAG: hypothetical protein SGJ11_10180, partial [Phycisphaerae bacterium]|nr:hypothetical protein [Phycisphaerae bacterium]
MAQNALATGAHDQRIQTEALAIVDRVVRGGHGQIDASLPERLRAELARTPDFARACVVLRSEDGSVETAAGDTELRGSDLPVPDARTTGTVTRIEALRPDGAPLALRSVAREYTSESGARHWIQVVVPAESGSGRDSVAPYFLIGIPIGVIAAAAMAWIMAGRLVRPIQRLATAARAV